MFESCTQLALHLCRAAGDVAAYSLDRRLIIQTAHFTREMSALFAQVQFRGRSAQSRQRAGLLHAVTPREALTQANADRPFAVAFDRNGAPKLDFGVRADAR